MKIEHHRLLIPLIGFALLASVDTTFAEATCEGSFPTATVCDDFNSTIKDTSVWGSDIKVGTPGDFSLFGFSLAYLQFGDTTLLGNVRRPALQQLPLDTDWVVEANVYADCVCYQASDVSRMGLYLENTQDPTDNIWLNGIATNSFPYDYESRFVNNGVPSATIGIHTNRFAALRLSFDHTKTNVVVDVGIAAASSGDPAFPIAAPTWVNLATNNITSWGLTNGNTFTISAIADVYLTAPASANNVIELFRITIGSTNANQTPIASNDVYFTAQDTPLNQAAPGVLGNDSDPESDPLTASIVTNPTHASSFALSPSGAFNYTPTNGFAGIDSFTYHANDGSTNSADATALISVRADTPTGTGVNVQLDASPLGVNPLSVTFSNVTLAGSTSITPLDLADAGTIPNSYTLFSNMVFEISTTASVTGNVDVCFTLTGSISSNTFAMLKVLHNENGTNVDRTSSSDFPTKTICATVPSLSPFSLAVLAPLPDLTAAITNTDFTCTNTTKGTICSSAGTLSLANEGVDYGSLTFRITTTKQEKPGKPPKWKVASLFEEIEFNLGSNPASLIQVHLSDDDTLDGTDTPLLKKPSSTLALDALTGTGKVLKMKLSLPKGVDLSGKYLIIEVDANDPKTGMDAVTEADETNNTAVIGPIP